MAVDGRVGGAHAQGDVGERRGVASRERLRLPGWLWLPASLAAGVALWALVVRLGEYPPYLLPGPDRVARRFVSAVREGIWWRHTRVTLIESVLGFGVGFLVAVVLGYGIARVRWLERVLSPYVAASQALPVIAIAPLLVLWFGYGLRSKVLVCALIVFFPILVNTVVGLRGIPKDLLEVARVFGAGPWQRIRLVELPLALPVLLGGVRLGLTLSITGAVVGELLGADAGLGVLLQVSNGGFDAALTFVALVTLVAMASMYYALATALDRLFLGWQER